MRIAHRCRRPAAPRAAPPAPRRAPARPGTAGGAMISAGRLAHGERGGAPCPGTMLAALDLRRHVELAALQPPGAARARAVATASTATAAAAAPQQRGLRADRRQPPRPVERERREEQRQLQPAHQCVPAQARGEIDQDAGGGTPDVVLGMRPDPELARTARGSRRAGAAARRGRAAPSAAARTPPSTSSDAEGRSAAA